MKNNMTKEILAVVAVGLVIALSVTAFLYFRNNPDLPSPVSPTPTPITTLPEKSDAPIQFLNLDNEAVFEDKALTITGRTFPNLPVVIFVNQKDFFTTSDTDGNFSYDINLDSGSNVLIVTTVDDQGNSYSDERLVVYTNKSLEEILLTEEEVKAVDDQAGASPSPEVSPTP